MSSDLTAAAHKGGRAKDTEIFRTVSEFVRPPVLIARSIAQYLAELDTADRQEPEVAQLRADRLQEKIAALKEQIQTMKNMKAQLKAAPDGQISQTDPDARSMRTRGNGIVGYNVQTAVDTKHHLIVEHEVTNQL